MLWILATSEGNKSMYTQGLAGTVHTDWYWSQLLCILHVSLAMQCYIVMWGNYLYSGHHCFLHLWRQLLAASPEAAGLAKGMFWSSSCCVAGRDWQAPCWASKPNMEGQGCNSEHRCQSYPASRAEPSSRQVLSSSISPLTRPPKLAPLVHGDNVSTTWC